jgi:hypothetical protein
MLLRVGSLLLAVSSLGILAAPITILRTHPDLATRSGRHVFAGAMGLSAVALLECLLALVPLRRGERWALLVAALPFLVVGLPIFVVDATYVPRATRWNTLAPQAAGLLMGTLALVLCGLGLAGKRGGA